MDKAKWIARYVAAYNDAPFDPSDKALQDAFDAWFVGYEGPCPAE
jgi:hypothetical protein